MAGIPPGTHARPPIRGADSCNPENSVRIYGAQNSCDIAIPGVIRAPILRGHLGGLDAGPDDTLGDRAGRPCLNTAIPFPFMTVATPTKDATGLAYNFRRAYHKFWRVTPRPSLIEAPSRKHAPDHR